MNSAPVLLPARMLSTGHSVANHDFSLFTTSAGKRMNGRGCELGRVLWDSVWVLLPVVLGRDITVMDATGTKYVMDTADVGCNMQIFTPLGMTRKLLGLVATGVRYSLVWVL